MVSSAQTPGLQKRSDSCRNRRLWCGTLAILTTGMLHWAPAHADDPCTDTDPEVARVVSALQRFDHLITKDGVFQVRKVGVGGQTAGDMPRFNISYHVRDHVLFQQQITSPPQSVADELAINPLRMRDGEKLGLAYSMGAGGRISCAYRMYDTGGHFHAKRGSW